ncbi:MAG: twin-arginine translocase subunit TatC [Bacteroidales bacterium]|nr:twin-arginine translocase subunit TatC [Bacteroidales bacterium]
MSPRPKKSIIRKRSKVAAKDNEMSFWDHIEELRGTLLRSILAIVSVSVVFLCFPKQIFKAVLWPTEPDFLLYRLPGVDFSMDLINIDLSAQFFVYLKVSVLCGLVLAFPFVIWEIWKFVSPALYDSEKKPVRKAFLLSSGLFYLGVAVGYFVVLPVCLMFFVNFSLSDVIVNTISLGSYMSLFTSMVFLIGILFEFPTVIMALSAIGVIDRGMLRKGRKFAIVIVMVISALITPSDPFSMFVLSLPLYGLYEFSILMCRTKA